YYIHLIHNDVIDVQYNDVKIIIDGNKTFHSLIADLKAAEDHIHLLHYIIRGDQLGTEIAKILIKIAKADVEVRVLYDDMGSRSLKKKYIKELEDSGVKVDAFFPPLITKINFIIN